MKNIILALLLLLVLSSCTAYQSTLSTSQETIEGPHVIIKDFQFQPYTITVNKGDTITFTNRDLDAHTLSYQGIESDPIETDESIQILASEEGIFDYESGNHPFMKGIIIVKEPLPKQQ